MDFGTLLVLGFLWFLFNLLRQGGSGASRRAPPLPPPPSTDATQREGNRLEILLRDLNRTLEEAGAVRTAEKDEELEAAEDAETLEVAPEVVTLETDVRRTARVRVDQDDLAEQVAARRLAAAQARSGPQTVATHREFDQRIRQEPADHTAVRTYTTQQLRDAVVWREILGPPAALRD